MRTVEEFNSKYKQYLEETHIGLNIEIPAIVSYLNEVFNDLIKIEGFTYQEIVIRHGLSRICTNLDELLPFAGRIIHRELEDKINFILKVEYEIENRLGSLNLDKYGKSI